MKGLAGVLKNPRMDRVTVTLCVTKYVLHVCVSTIRVETKLSYFASESLENSPMLHRT